MELLTHEFSRVEFLAAGVAESNLFLQVHSKKKKAHTAKVSLEPTWVGVSLFCFFVARDQMNRMLRDINLEAIALFSC